MKYIDIHCHLNLSQYDLDRDEVISRAREKEVGMIVVGVDKASSEKAVEIAEANENIWAIVGLHPADNSTESFDVDFYKKLAMHPKVVGIGECGFDYYHMSYTDKSRQQEIFEKQITVANEVKKPLMLHLRNGVKGESAYKDALEILKKHAKVPGNVHFFAGNIEEAYEFIKLGFRLSFTGVITFARDYDEVIKNIPLDMIMVETDAPYVAPIPHRGKKNEPAYVIEIANKIAEIRGEASDKVQKKLMENAKALFSLS
ncbi:MAG: TatD family hydrolase [Candidatus Taylorbacteria bacterium]|nr:TatD family hydrolase [Candidatus Taylorbacteria bacterium]